MTSRRPFLLASSAFLALAIGLTGCTSPDVTAAPSPSGSADAAETTSPSPTTAPTVVPTTTPSATPTPVATKPTVGDLIITASGIAPLVVGKPVPKMAKSAAIVSWNPTLCEPYGGGYDTNYPKVTVPSSAKKWVPFGVPVLGEKRTSPIRAVIARSPEIKTETGISAGSSLAELKAAYPGIKRAVKGPISDSYAVTGDGGRLVFEIGKDSGNYWDQTPDAIGNVLWVYAIPTGSTMLGIAGSGAGSTCGD